MVCIDDVLYLSSAGCAVIERASMALSWLMAMVLLLLALPLSTAFMHEWRATAALLRQQQRQRGEAAILQNSASMQRTSGSQGTNGPAGHTTTFSTSTTGAGYGGPNGVGGYGKTHGSPAGPAGYP